MKKILLASFIALMFSGCFVDMIREESHESLLKPDVEWVVYKIILESGEVIEPNWQWRELHSDMQFDVKQNRIFGKAVCNNYFATFALKGKQLTISHSGSSRRLCFSNESMDYEMKFLKNLEGSFEVRQKNKEMRLYSPRATYYLREDSQAHDHSKQ